MKNGNSEKWRRKKGKDGLDAVGLAEITQSSAYSNSSRLRPTVTLKLRRVGSTYFDAFNLHQKNGIAPKLFNTVRVVSRDFYVI